MAYPPGVAYMNADDRSDGWFCRLTELGRVRSVTVVPLRSASRYSGQDSYATLCRLRSRSWPSWSSGGTRPITWLPAVVLPWAQTSQPCVPSAFSCSSMRATLSAVQAMVLYSKGSTCRAPLEKCSVVIARSVRGACCGFTGVSAASSLERPDHYVDNNYRTTM